MQRHVGHDPSKVMTKLRQQRMFHSPVVGGCVKSVFSFCFDGDNWWNIGAIHVKLLTYLLSLSNYSLLSLCNPKVHYRAHKSLPPDPVLNQPNPIRPIYPCLPKVRLNVIHPPTPWSSLRASQPKPCKHLSLSPFVPLVPSTSFSLI